MGKNPLLPAVPTESRGWDGVFFSIKSRRDLLVELQIFIRDRKRNVAVATGFGFDEAFIWWDWVHGNKIRDLKKLP